MASKIEKAQLNYENLLRELGERAEMVGMVENAKPAILKKFKRAKEGLDDRKLELDFLITEIEQLSEQQSDSQDVTQQSIDELKKEISEKEELAEVKHSKANVPRKKLAGAEYDLKFITKGLAEEKKKRIHRVKREEFKKAKDHEENIKRMKIEVMRRKKALVDMRREIKEFEGPAKKLDKDVEELRVKLDELEERIEAESDGGGAELLEDLKRQREAKERDVKRAEQHVQDTLADVGEDFYERRLKHPVLSKYYADLDVVADAIDRLNG